MNDLVNLAKTLAADRYNANLRMVLADELEASEAQVEKWVRRGVRRGEPHFQQQTTSNGYAELAAGLRVTAERDNDMWKAQYAQTVGGWRAELIRRMSELPNESKRCPSCLYGSKAWFDCHKYQARKNACSSCQYQLLEVESSLASWAINYVNGNDGRMGYGNVAYGHVAATTVVLNEPFHRETVELVWKDGFIFSVTARLDALRTLLPDLVLKHPITKVLATDFEPHIGETGSAFVGETRHDEPRQHQDVPTSVFSRLRLGWGESAEGGYLDIDRLGEPREAWRVYNEVKDAFKDVSAAILDEADAVATRQLAADLEAANTTPEGGE